MKTIKRQLCTLGLLSALCLGFAAQGQKVIAWGIDYKGELLVPADATNVIAVSAGHYTSMALKADGTLLAWGAITNVPAAAINVIAIAAGADYDLALRADGTVVQWNNAGDKPVPQLVSNIVAITAGDHFLGLRADGTIVAWDPYRISKLPNSLLPCKTIASDSRFIAVQNDGSVLAWDDLGTLWGPAANIRDVVSISTRGYRVTALKANGLAASWSIDASSRWVLSSAQSNLVMVASTSDRSYALKEDGRVVLWESWHSYPEIPANATNITAISGGYSHVLAIQGDGHPQLFGNPAYRSWAAAGTPLPLAARVAGVQPMSYQWFANGSPIPGATNAHPRITAQFGTDNIGYSVVASNALGAITSVVAKIEIKPVAVWGYNADNQCLIPSSLIDPVSISAGPFHGLGLDANGNITAWGKDWRKNDSRYPISAIAVPSQATNVVAVAGFGDNSMALRTDGTIIGWGASRFGETNVPVSATNVIAIAGGDQHAIALRGDGTVVAWGTNEESMLDVPQSAVGIKAIAAGYYHNLALRRDGTVIGWGEVTVPPSATNIMAIAAGWGHSIAVRKDGTLLAWGDNTYGQATIPPEATNIVDVKAGWYHNLALRADGSLIAWGKNVRGTTIIPPGVQGVTQIAVGEDFSLALLGFGKPRFARQLQHITTGASGVAVLKAQVQGALPMSYQWYHDGVPVQGATNSTLIFDSTQPTDAGNYTLAARNSLGKATSDSTFLEVQGSPVLPSVIGQNVMPGTSVTLNPAITGIQPMTYQWQLNGRNLTDNNRLSGSTSAALHLNSTTAADGGTYTLIASNAYGVVTGAVARIAVTPVIAWGDNSLGQCDVPVEASNVVAVACGGNHTIALKDDGTVIGWGDNSRYQNEIPESATNIVQIADGGTHWIGLRADGTVITCGTSDGWPPNMRKSATNIIAIAATPNMNLAWRIDGTIIMWRQDIVSYYSPYEDNLGTNVTAAVLTLFRSIPTTYYTKNDGTAGAIWGSTPFSSPITNAVGITTAPDRILVQLQDGSVWSGSTAISSSNFTLISPDAIMLSASRDGSLLVHDDGSVTAWNDSIWSQISVPDGLKDPLSIGMGDAHYAAVQNLDQKQTVKHRFYSVRSETPVILNTTIPGAQLGRVQWYKNGTPIQGVQGPVLAIACATAGNSGQYTIQSTTQQGASELEMIDLVVGPEPGFYTLEPSKTATIRSAVSFTASGFGELPLQYQWQFHGKNLIDDERITGSQTPTLQINSVKLEDDGDYTLVVSNKYGSYSSVATRLHTTTIACWETPGAYSVGLPPISLQNAVAVANGRTHAMALRSDGSVVCWGNSLAVASYPPRNATNLVAIAAGDGHSIALKKDGTVVTWGTVDAPTKISNIIAIAAGDSFGIGLKNDGTVHTWGDPLLPTPPSSATNIIAITAGYDHVLALRADGNVITWGKSDTYGQLDIPQSATNVIAIAAGESCSMALRRDGVIVSWGNTAVVPDSATNIVDIAAYALSGMGLRRDGTILTWGNTPQPPQWLSNVVAITSIPTRGLAIIDAGTGFTHQTLAAGQSASLTAGLRPGAHYQWLWNGMVIPGQTNAVLDFNSLRWTHSGIYRSIVDYGRYTTTNAPITLDIPRTQLKFDLSALAESPARLILTNASGVGSVVLYESPNVVNWSPVATNDSILGPIEFDNPGTSNLRFFQAVEEP